MFKCLATQTNKAIEGINFYLYILDPQVIRDENSVLCPNAKKSLVLLDWHRTAKKMYMGETKLHVLLSIGADASNKYPCHGIIVSK